jgi:hypothetical protein
MRAKRDYDERIRGLKGHESIAQALSWVCCSNGSVLTEGRQKSYHGMLYLAHLQHLQPGGPGVFPTRRYEDAL